MIVNSLCSCLRPSGAGVLVALLAICSACSPPLASPPEPMGSSAMVETSLPARRSQTSSPSQPIFNTATRSATALPAKPFATAEKPSPTPALPPSPLANQGPRSPSRVVGFTFPDSEVVYSPSAADFNVQAYLDQTAGFLKGYREYLKSTAWTSAAAIIQRVALENSINPRLLLSLLEMVCGCVSGELRPEVSSEYLLGNRDFRRQGLYRQLSWAASRLSAGYYGWKSAQLSEITLADGSTLAIEPTWNAGSVAILTFFAFYDPQTTLQAIQPEDGVLAVHRRLFGDFEQRAATVEPLLPEGLTQPPFILPFEEGRMWAFTSGPHVVWEKEGALAALDFAPATYDHGCVPTDAWVVAVADGVVVRSEFGYVILDVDDPSGMPADGIEQTGWAVFYLHIAEQGRVPAGQRLKAGERIGKPSCEGGPATGTHVHLARKYNGEWIAAAGAIPFVLDGWIAQAAEKPYEGSLVKDGQQVIARPYGSYVTKIARPTATPTATKPSLPEPLP